jgi:RNA 2',3'-cyclic 3'-phosphodiesterase
MLRVDSLPERVRAFIAIRLEKPVEDAVAALIARLSAPAEAPASAIRASAIRWIPRANLHLTLFFLGPSVPRKDLAPLADALDAIGAAAMPFEAVARGVGAFPNLGRPSIIWVGLESVALVALAGQVIAAAERCGFEPERRAYTPHLTIGRVRARIPAHLRRSLRAEADSAFGTSKVERMILYRSETGSRAAVYSEIAAFPLGPR